MQHSHRPTKINKRKALKDEDSFQGRKHKKRPTKGRKPVSNKSYHH